MSSEILNFPRESRGLEVGFRGSGLERLSLSHTRIHTHKLIHTHIHTYTPTQTHIHTNIHIYTQTDTHTHTITHTLGMWGLGFGVWGVVS